MNDAANIQCFFFFSVTIVQKIYILNKNASSHIKHVIFSLLGLKSGDILFPYLIITVYTVKKKRKEKLTLHLKPLSEMY